MSYSSDRAEALLEELVPAGAYNEHTGNLFVHGQCYTYVIQLHDRTLVYDKKGRELGRACLHLIPPKGQTYLPTHDRMLAEYILIRANELKYLRTANLFWNNPFHKPGGSKQILLTLAIVGVGVGVTLIVINFITEIYKFLR